MLLRKSMASTAIVLAAILSLSACGGSDEGSDAKRPSIKEISSAIQAPPAEGEAVVTKEQADCMAEVLHSSKLTDDTLRKAVDTDGAYFETESNELPEADQEVLADSKITNDTLECLGIDPNAPMDDLQDAPAPEATDSVAPGEETTGPDDASEIP